jgi:hypothetical protein
MLQRDHLLTKHTFSPEEDPSTHLEKISYRLTVPFIANLFQLGPLGVFLLQNVLGLILIACSLKFGERVTSDRVSALLFTAGLVFTYAGSSYFFDVWGILDPFGYFFLFWALYYPRPWSVMLSIFLASFTDERAFIASFLVLGYHYFRLGPEKPGRTGPHGRIDRSFLAGLAGAFGYLICRGILHQWFGFRTGTTHLGLLPFLQNIDQIAWGLWSGFEGGWMILLAYFILLWTNRERSAFLVQSMVFVVVLMVAISVWDVTRSAAYGFVLMYPSLVYLHKTLGPVQLKTLLFFSCVVSFLHPMYFLLGGAILRPVDPIPIRLLHVLKHFVVE